MISSVSSFMYLNADRFSSVSFLRKFSISSAEEKSAAIFVVSGYLKVRAGACFLVMANQEREKMGLENPVVHDTDKAIQVAVQAIRELIRADKENQ